VLESTLVDEVIEGARCTIKCSDSSQLLRPVTALRGKVQQVQVQQSIPQVRCRGSMKGAEMQLVHVTPVCKQRDGPSVDCSVRME
jgi:hypothetical protein